ncbi:MAG: A/G-specific adenine glycosylase [Parachlamydiaceae bacterium]|nr:A/G-specific adenine glycosylase [Parachlamydiaceae bacterium]
MKLDYLSLKKWFLEAQRDLPWRENRTPYAVWVSEMMLQQTQVAVVIPYFYRWMQLFPTIKDLADASLDDVIKAWEGLGYYSRARYLHAGAQYIIQHHQGQFPDQIDDLKNIKGLGPYTLGAIRSFAFHQRTAAVDGNVLRVLARYLGMEEDIAKPKVVVAMRQVAESLLPEEESWITNEALIELGATICGRTPNCTKCPLRKTCWAHLNGKEGVLPIKSSKVCVERLFRAVAIIRWKDCFLIRRGQKGEIMSDLHEFPFFESDESGTTSEYVCDQINKRFEFHANWSHTSPKVTHSFTRYRVQLDPLHFECAAKKKPSLPPSHFWLSKDEIAQLAFSSGHRRLLLSL